MRRTLPFLCLFLLAGCVEPTGAFIGASAASVAVFGRSVPDLAVSGITGKDCSVVRLDEGKSYCAPPEPPPGTPRYCTRSLGKVDCWASPAVLPASQQGVADGPTLSANQERDRTAPWPKALTAFPP
jgi:hypothetical protein